MRLDSWRHFDFWLLGAVLALVIFGIAMVDSAIAGNIELIENDTVARQILFAAIGLVIILFATVLDYHLWVIVGRLMYLLLVIFLGITLFGSGEAEFGAQRWLNVGFAIVQPSELAKISIIIVMSDIFARNKEKVANLGWVIRSSMITLGLVGLIVAQPDLSTSIVVLVIWGALLFASGLKVNHIFTFGMLALILPIIAFPFLEGYQQQRIVNFVAPDEDARFGEIYNVNQALITIGSGGLFGKGYGQGTQTQLRFLKVRHTDFIFSVISEEFGFVGAVVLLGLIFFVIARCIRAAQLAPDLFGALMCYGVATVLSLQTIVNVGMNLNLMPVTGLPLPFVSQGGSALLSLMLGIGLVESVVSRQQT